MEAADVFIKSFECFKGIKEIFLFFVKKMDASVSDRSELYEDVRMPPSQLGASCRKLPQKHHVAAMVNVLLGCAFS